MKKDILASILLVFISPSVFAENFTVTTTEELREVLFTAALNSEDNIITLSSGTYFADGTFEIPFVTENKKITIIGAGRESTILNGDGKSPVIAHLANLSQSPSSIQLTLEFQDLTVQNGYCSRTVCGIYDHYDGDVYVVASGISAAISDLVLKNVAIRNNMGGNTNHISAVFAYNATVDDSLFIGNSNDWGGGLYAEQRVLINNSEFIDNKAAWAGGAVVAHVYGHIGDGEGASIIKNTTFINNSAYKFGGAIYSLDERHSNLTVSESKFVGNSVADGLGGAIQTRNKGSIIIDSSEFLSNSAGGVAAPECNFVNTGYCSGHGGAISVDGYYGGSLSIQGSRFYRNSAQNFGGAVAIVYSCRSDSDGIPCFLEQEEILTNTVSGTTFDNNISPVGAAIFVNEGQAIGNRYSYGEINIEQSDFIENDVYTPHQATSDSVVVIPKSEELAQLIAYEPVITLGDEIEITIDVPSSQRKLSANTYLFETPLNGMSIVHDNDEITVDGNVASWTTIIHPNSPSRLVTITFDSSSLSRGQMINTQITYSHDDFETILPISIRVEGPETDPSSGGGSMGLLFLLCCILPLVRKGCGVIGPQGPRVRSNGMTRPPP